MEPHKKSFSSMEIHLENSKLCIFSWDEET